MDADDSIVEHIYYERGKNECKDNCTKKNMRLWQSGYDKGFSDAQEILAKKFEKMISELSDIKQVKSNSKKKLDN